MMAIFGGMVRFFFSRFREDRLNKITGLLAGRNYSGAAPRQDDHGKTLTGAMYNFRLNVSVAKRLAWPVLFYSSKVMTRILSTSHAEWPLFSFIKSNSITS